MDFFSLIEARHSIRAFTDQPVTHEQVQHILEATARAPSAGNRQAFEVFLVDANCDRAALVTAGNEQEFLAQAQVVLVFCTHAELNADRYGKRGADLYCIQDATIACTYAMLAATELGLATVWVGAFNEEAVRKFVHAKPGMRPVAMLPIGYAAEAPTIRSRRNLGDLVHTVN